MGKSTCSDDDFGPRIGGSYQASIPALQSSAEVKYDEKAKQIWSLEQMEANVDLRPFMLSCRFQEKEIVS